ncbi:MAG: hypothetical protein ACLQUY_20290 [Ktedonobacterales bacterium]
MAESSIGKIVHSESHVRYTCQVFTQGEVARPPQPADYAFGNFVRVQLRHSPEIVSGRGADVAISWAIGMIYDTILVNPSFGTLGPRLSNDDQVQLFSPDYLSERAVLVSILLLGTMAVGAASTVTQVSHGVPALALDLGAEVSGLDDSGLSAFHYFADHGTPGGSRPYLHMGYLAHALTIDHSLLPVAMLRTIERLEWLFPENRALLSIVKRNFAWKMKVETAG